MKFTRRRFLKAAVISVAVTPHFGVQGSALAQCRNPVAFVWCTRVYGSRVMGSPLPPRIKAALLVAIVVGCYERWC